MKRHNTYEGFKILSYSPGKSITNYVHIYIHIYIYKHIRIYMCVYDATIYLFVGAKVRVRSTGNKLGINISRG